ncbi:MAG: hypothetical protein ACSLFP_04155 [Acidimicrobiales bacterium]
MRFDELILTVADEELHVRFHPELTLLSGLAAQERQALADSVLGALAGGGDRATVRYVDATGRTVEVTNAAGAPAARLDDGSPVDPPMGRRSREIVRSALVLGADALGVTARPRRDDEPPELQEARADLEALATELEAALEEEQQTTGLRSELADVDEQLHRARDGAARRAYAEVLAALERVRAELATLEGGTSGVDGDRRLLAGADQARSAAQRWEAAEADARSVAGPPTDADDAPDPDQLERLAQVPGAAPTDLHELVDDVVATTDRRERLDRRLQDLAVATLPAPSDPLVGDLGLLDQDQVWATAEALAVAGDALDEVRIALGGLGTEEGGPDPIVIDQLEAAHTALDDAEREAEAVRVTGVAGAGLGVAIAAAGAIGGLLLLVVVGLLIAAGVGTATLLLPKSRVAKAAEREQAALAQAGATSYLGFHLRRVEATVDPALRQEVEGILADHGRARAAWVELVGPEIDVARARALEDEIRSYHEALRSLGGAADEIEELRRELADHAEPARQQAWDALAATCEPFGLRRGDLGDVATAVPAMVDAQVEAGRQARRQAEALAARAVADAAAAELDALLLPLGFDSGDLAARVGAMEWAVTGAAEREAARADARPIPEVAADVARLSAEAERLRQPEWASVTAAEADGPSIEELEERQAKLRAELERVRPRVDVARLADRHDALERRVISLEARLGADGGLGDPGALADIQQHLLAHLAEASHAGPHDDPLPVILDDVFARVPADRKWDLLDLLLRLAERHQLVYLSDDPFVAAWGRQRSTDGSITLLEAAPEAV